MRDDSGPPRLSRGAAYRREFHFSRALFTPHPFEEPHWRVQYGEGAWGASKSLYLMMRMVLALLHIAGMVVSIAQVTHLPTWPVFLTNWTYTLQTLYFICAATAAARIHLDHYATGDTDPPPPLVGAAWRLRSVVLPSAYVVTTIYWGLMYRGGGISASNLLVHGMNSIAVTLDILMSAYTYRLVHAMYALGYLGVFVMFSAVHYATGVGDGNGHRYIYPQLEWSNAKMGGALFTCIIVTLLLPIIAHAQWGIARLRDNATRRPSYRRGTVPKMVSVAPTPGSPAAVAWRTPPPLTLTPHEEGNMVKITCA